MLKLPHYLTTYSFQFSSVAQSCLDSLQPHELQHARPPCPSPTPRVHANSSPSSQWWSSSHLILCHSLLLLPAIPPSIRVFSNESSLHMRWPKYWSFSFSISPSSTQDWFPLRLTGLISLQYKELSKVFSNTTIQSIHFPALSFLYSPTLTSIHDYWKNHSLDWMDLCWQSNVSAFEYAI